MLINLEINTIKYLRSFIKYSYNALLNYWSYLIILLKSKKTAASTVRSGTLMVTKKKRCSYSERQL